MPSGRVEGMHSRSLSFDQSDGHYADDNGIKTSVASATTAQSYIGGALNGTNVCGAGFAGLISWPTVKASSTVGAFVAGSAIVFTGTYDGVPTTRTALLTSADGNETIKADGPLDIGSVTLIAVAAQADTDGTLEFGWSDVGPKPSRPAWRIVPRAAATAGALHIANEAGEVDAEITLPIHAAHEAWVRRIFGDTTIDVTAYE